MHPDRGAFRPAREQVHAKMRHHYVDEEEDKVEDYDYDKEWRVQGVCRAAERLCEIDEEKEVQEQRS